MSNIQARKGNRQDPDRCVGFRLTVPNRRFRIHRFTLFRMCEFSKPVLVLGLGVRRGVVTSPRTRPRLPHHVIALSDHSRDRIAHLFAPNLLIPTLTSLRCRLCCRMQRFRVGERVSSMVGVGTNGDWGSECIRVHIITDPKAARNCANKPRPVPPF